MNVAYTLDTNMAIEGSELGSNRITESGAYVGVITEAKKIVTPNNAQGIEFSFRRDDGAEANYITIYTVKKDGTQAFGIKQLHAMMSCLGIKAITEQNRIIKEYDQNVRQIIEINGVVHPELENKPIGLALQKEEYLNSNGDTKYKFTIVAPFKVDTRQVAKEIINNQPAQALDKIINRLIDKKQPQQIQFSGNTQDEYFNEEPAF